MEKRIPSRNALCKHSAKSLELHILNQWGLGKIKGGGFYPDCTLSKSLCGVHLLMFSLSKNVLKVWCWVVLCLQKNPNVEVSAYGRAGTGMWTKPRVCPWMQLRQPSGWLQPPKGGGTGFERMRANGIKDCNFLHRERNLAAHSWGQMDNLFYFQYQWNFSGFRGLPPLIGPVYAIHIYLEMHWKQWWITSFSSIWKTREAIVGMSNLESSRNTTSYTWNFAKHVGH